MTKPKPETAADEPEPERVWIVSGDNRINSLSYNVPKKKGPSAKRTVVITDPETGQPRTAIVDVEDPGNDLEARSVMLLPGLSCVEPEVLERCGGEAAVRAIGCRVEDPTLSPPFYARQLADRTASRGALHAWRARETRAEVIEAIDQRLARRSSASERATAKAAGEVADV